MFTTIANAIRRGFSIGIAVVEGPFYHNAYLLLVYVVPADDLRLQDSFSRPSSDSDIMLHAHCIAPIIIRSSAFTIKGSSVKRFTRNGEKTKRLIREKKKSTSDRDFGRRVTWLGRCANVLFSRFVWTAVNYCWRTSWFWVASINCKL